ncbi:chemotaxis protein CheA [Curvibacter sp. RS43]|uniref:chemotaxis protein CheA n=1 Tax=Curvibacter microcysteis TaxID=3026419 RepID=UPI002362462B|nr:chemotaxis protein CheA [Curvibacter sp. RS43]MDD0809900.1 chemotaxis protein CheA [Curvibacter sp. RS43]
MSQTDSDADYDFIAAAMPAFINEAREQVTHIEQLLLQLEEDPHNREQLDALFRCAHTVKGSAGIFGLDQVVNFTHHIETLLDELREGHLQLDTVLSSLLLACNDQILALVNQAAGEAQDDAAQQDRREALVRQLRQAMGGPSEAPAVEAAASASPSAAEARLGRWHLSAHFGADCFRHGMDPLSVVRYLSSHTEVMALASDRSRIPALADLDPENCHLSVEVSMRSDGPQAAVDDAFSFIRDDCQLHLIPPTAPTSRFVDLIEDLPDHPRLGDLLVSVGAITEDQLAAGLEQQAQDRVLRPLGTAPRLGEILQEQAGLDQEVLAAAVHKQQRPREAASDEQRYIRIPADRLDAVINLLGELVTAAAGADMLARQTRQSRLIEANEHIGHLIEEIRNGTLQLRMVPMGATFNRFRRVVRDTAAELGKEVALEIVGADTELDKAVVEKIGDPLMHLVRNGLDHGLETPAERLAKGKPAQGRLVLSAQHESGSILIRISDDGRGVDRQRVLQRAWERGLVEPGVVPPDEDILQLIFEPGFSTAAQVTNLSGRGVGMDVVRQNIEALRGSVTVYSEAGQGTDIDIRLPLTLAIIDGFLISVGPSKFVLPLEAVVEVVEGQAGQHEAQLAPSADPSGRFCMPLRGQLLPVISLRQLYGLDSPRPDRVSIVVVQAGPTRFGLEVDQLLGQHQTVIKPLGRLFHTLRGISGSSVLGSGEVALIFDVLALGSLAVQGLRRPSPQASSLSP